MSASSQSLRLPKRDAGVGLITAIFLLVVLSGLSVALVMVFNAQRATSTLDEQGSRAYQAARAGMEWAVFQKLRNNSTCPALNTSFPMPGGTSLSAFVVTVKCTETTAPLRADLNPWVIEVTACNLQPTNGSCPNPSNSPDYVQRKIEVRL